MLSCAGREIMVKTVLQSFPNYPMNVFYIPMTLCNEIEGMINSFWWGSKKGDSRGINWLAWDPLCVPKKFGGMGFRKLHDFNLAMLSKQGWNLLTKTNSLVSRLFKARYFPLCSFL